MATDATSKRKLLPDADRILKTQYRCGPVQFAGTSDALFERHLLFDDGVDPAAATMRDKFEALARGNGALKSGVQAQRASRLHDHGPCQTKS